MVRVGRNTPCPLPDTVGKPLKRLSWQSFILTFHRVDLKSWKPVFLILSPLYSPPLCFRRSLERHSGWLSWDTGITIKANRQKKTHSTDMFPGNDQKGQHPESQEPVPLPSTVTPVSSPGTLQTCLAWSLTVKACSPTSPPVLSGLYLNWTGHHPRSKVSPSYPPAWAWSPLHFSPPHRIQPTWKRHLELLLYSVFPKEDYRSLLPIWHLQQGLRKSLGSLGAHPPSHWGRWRLPFCLLQSHGQGLPQSHRQLCTRRCNYLN